MSAVRVLIVDDEAPARGKIARLLGCDTRFACVGEASDGLEALEKIRNLSPDVVFLDVQMPGLDGFEVLRALSAHVQLGVIFSTAYDRYALRAFDAHALDYLLKPYDAARFRQALDKAYALHLGRRGGDPASPDRGLHTDERLTVRSVDGAWLVLGFEDIVRLSAANKHTCVLTVSGEHLVRRPLSELAALLDRRFVRIHRGEVVNVTMVVRVEPRSHGDAVLVLRDGTERPLARSQRQRFLDILGSSR
ncbi:MAG: hypothetical protein RL385_2631 [Pseudomonadota bacterium]|jgi:two-component system LytT family response regulator